MEYFWLLAQLGDSEFCRYRLVLDDSIRSFQFCCNFWAQRLLCRGSPGFHGIHWSPPLRWPVALESERSLTICSPRPPICLSLANVWPLSKRAPNSFRYPFKEAMYSPIAQARSKHRALAIAVSGLCAISAGCIHCLHGLRPKL
ncbi:hypothetical protein AVEN_1830-1 [Araneus ventricosus]|uniref:Uncharacterized protein n=1 Tax=Araneus ventricosus TaxID=182803 RepID=A0A4Y2SWX7_ARAVE|nr:hypothetical protein AVEN_1830-1 [Araneus ventricosus]